MDNFNIEEAKENVRVALWGLLDSIAKGGTVSANKGPTGYFDSLGELLSMWFDSYWRPETILKHQFLSKGEFEIFKEFSQTLENEFPVENTLSIESNINNLSSNKGWLTVVKAANEALKKLKNLNC